MEEDEKMGQGLGIECRIVFPSREIRVMEGESDLIRNDTK